MKQYHKNPRQISKKQLARLEGSLDELGDLSGVVHDLNSDEIIGGNMRSRVFDVNKCEITFSKQFDEPLEDGTVALGYIIWKNKWNNYRQVRWTPKQCERANLAANSMGGSWDWSELPNWEPATLEWAGFDAEMLKWEKQNVTGISEFLKSEAPTQDAEPQTDRAAELLEKWGVQPGDLWLIGDHRLICGDCTDAATVARVMDEEKARATITDPPFSVRDDEWDKFEDFFGFTYLWFTLAIANSELIAAFFPDKFLPLLPKVADKAGVPFRRSLVWRKPAGSQMAGASKDGYWYDFEFVQVYGEKTTPNLKNTKMSVFEYRTITGQEHGAEKPVETYQEVLEGYTIEGDLVFEPFSGTGTNLAACENLRRRCRAIEISPAYVAVALERMAQAFPHLDIRRAE